MSMTMNQEEQVLERSLKALLTTHGYQNVLDHLVKVVRSETQPKEAAWMPGLDDLMSLTPDERTTFLKAAVEDALPLYEADRARPEAERELTADLETGDFHDYEASAPGVEEQHNADPVRGEIWRVDFEPTQGSETGKARPAVVIGDEQLGKLQVRIVVPITGWNERYRNHPWMTEINPDQQNGLTKPSAADALQIRTVSLLRFQEHIGNLPTPTVDEIAGRIALCVRAPNR